MKVFAKFYVLRNRKNVLFMINLFKFIKITIFFQHVNLSVAGNVQLRIKVSRNPT